MEKKFKRTTVTSALPYANGPVHIGHLAGVYVPADIYVRYLRLKKRMCSSLVVLTNTECPSPSVPRRKASLHRISWTATTPSSRILSRNLVSHSMCTDVLLLRLITKWLLISSVNCTTSMSSSKKLPCSITTRKHIPSWPTVTSRENVRAAMHRAPTVTSAKNAVALCRLRN